ncbi:ATPase, T2SS/T4P/T4SS family [Paenibacillus sp. YPG26]|uniref:ATPase, T2SS/T4P/T4SS family n=1 Tax=Paenibacillus sp. YPG26 TaxID=2878915 RepID=UPI00203FB9C9|nr:ATPase, T2SS/T4P/T4SS family [Paenibacillus sp. YPG26]USB34906.1 Flp pilus assembly complex ATPase component TadA [Paenibacillus sp. YPG26]
MASGINAVAIGVIGLFVLLFVILKVFVPSRSQHETVHQEERFTLNALIQSIKQSLHELSRTRVDDWKYGEEEYRRISNQRTELRKALKGCVSGDYSDKEYVKLYIADLLQTSYGIDSITINKIIPFEELHLLSIQDRFEILLYLYKSSHGENAISTLIEKYELDKVRTSSDGDDQVFEITAEDIDYVFCLENRPLLFQEKLDIVVQRIYQQYKGFSVADELRDQRIDGVSGGVSGVPEQDCRRGIRQDFEVAGYDTQLRKGPCHGPKNYESLWIFYKGKSIHLPFLSFGSESELKRVCQNIYKYNLPGQLSESSGYKVNEMKDGSRVVVVRPPFSESWAFFVRKFDVKSAVLAQLIKDENAELPIELLKYLMKGGRITAITGAQGSGKTTLLMAMVKHIYASYTLRVQEMSFELHLRSLYSKRNILSFKETDYISGQAGLDLQKKTDGAVNILGEVATDEVATWMIQMAQVASLFTIFTHHAKTFDDLIQSLRNSLLKSGMFRDERMAERQVLSVINFNIHLRADLNGNRYIERITECVNSNRDKGRNIIEFHNGRYVLVNSLSSHSIQEMTGQMTSEDASSFRTFVSTYWGEHIGA